MPADVAARGSDQDLVIDLSAYDNLEEMKQQLEQSLNLLEDFGHKDEVCIDVGMMRLTEKQLRELENVVKLFGLSLKELKYSQKQWSGKVPHRVPLDSHQILQGGDTVMISRNLRSGQKFYTRGNIVILGDINPGAEVIAGGSILVMGSLRGVAHAGALGYEEAVIAAFRLNPTQLRIADHITRAPDGESIEVGSPELARIRAGKVVIEKLKI
ncbi:MAG: septum site-determining protein MinC [Syntrophomonadaceae bacterium]